MPFKLYDFQPLNFYNSKFSSTIVGLQDFKKALQFDYYSEITIKNKSSIDKTLDMVLELDCALHLTDVLDHLKKGYWGTRENSEASLAKSFETLVVQNGDWDMDIKELTISFRDTNVVIKNLYKYSILESFNTIFQDIASHYISISKGMTEQPEEIFVPVFEDNLSSDCLALIHKLEKNPTPNSYREYWGIYMESEIDGLIFDLRTHKFISANLDYCILDDTNH